MHVISSNVILYNIRKVIAVLVLVLIVVVGIVAVVAVVMIWLVTMGERCKFNHGY